MKRLLMVFILILMCNVYGAMAEDCNHKWIDGECDKCGLKEVMLIYRWTDLGDYYTQYPKEIEEELEIGNFSSKTVYLKQPKSSIFTISPLSQTRLDPGERAFFYISPKYDLSSGHHSANLIIYDQSGKKLDSVNFSFDIAKRPPVVIKLVQGAGYELSDTWDWSTDYILMEKGQQTEIRLEINKKYQITEDFAIKANGKKLEPKKIDERSYDIVLYNVTEDMSIKVEGVVLNIINTQPKSQTVSAGETARFTIEATGDDLKYQWYYRKNSSSDWVEASSTSATYSFKMKESFHGRQICCKVTNARGKTLSTSKIVSVKLPLAKIITQPSDAWAYEDETAKVTVKATGDGLKYTWYYKDRSMSDFTKSTTTSATYSLKMNESRDGRKLYCVVSDAYGKSVQTDTVTLDTRFKATITKQPKSVTVSAGETAKFTIGATGDGIKYQWYYKKSGSDTWSKSSQTSAAYSFTMKESYDGRQIRCKVKDEYGNTATTNAVNLKLPVAKITTQPKSATVSVGEKAEFTVAATGDGLTYQWQYKKSGSSTWTNASSTSTAYSFTMKESYDGRQIRCKVKDAYGNTATTNAVNLKLPVAKITSQPKSKSVAVGDKATFTIKATGDGLTYQWQYKKSGTSTWSTASSTSTTYSFTMKESYDNRSIRCKVTDAYGNTVTSSSAKLTLE